MDAVRSEISGSVKHKVYQRDRWRIPPADGYSTHRITIFAEYVREFGPVEMPTGTRRAGRELWVKASCSRVTACN